MLYWMTRPMGAGRIAKPRPRRRCGRVFLLCIVYAWRVLEGSGNFSATFILQKCVSKEDKTLVLLGFLLHRIANLLSSKKKLKAKRQAVKAWLRENMHTPVAQLIGKLNQKLRGHYNYYGVTHNAKKMVDFYQYVKWQLLRTLKRRSQRDKTNWDKLNRIFALFPILTPKIRVNIWER